MKNFKKKMGVVLSTALVAGGVLTACGGGGSQPAATDKPKDAANSAAPASGGDYKEVTIRLAYNLPQEHHISKGIEQFAKNVTERSGGKVKVQVFPAGQLLSDKEMNQAILTGGVEMGLNSSSLWASIVPAMGIFDVPFTMPSYDLAGKILSGDVRNKLNAEMEKKGAKVLLYGDYGYGQFANNVKPLKKPEDFKDLKLRSQGELASELIKSYGAAPVFMGAGEVYTALQRKTIDGATSGSTAMLERKYNEVAKYLTICNAFYLEFPLVVNKQFFDQLPPNTQELITKTAKETEDWIRGQAEKADKAATEELKKKGMDVYEVPASDFAAWQSAAKPAWDSYTKNAGDLGKQLLEDVQKAQK